jgi:hypothetical protein
MSAIGWIVIMILLALVGILLSWFQSGTRQLFLTNPLGKVHLKYDDKFVRISVGMATDYKKNEKTPAVFVYATDASSVFSSEIENALFGTWKLTPQQIESTIEILQTPSEHEVYWGEKNRQMSILNQDNTQIIFYNHYLGYFYKRLAIDVDARDVQELRQLFQRVKTLLKNDAGAST